MPSQVMKAPLFEHHDNENVYLGIATAMIQVTKPEFKEYQQQVVKNAALLAKLLQEAGYKCVTDGTDNHLVWVDLRNQGLNGSRAERILEEISIACNKNTVPGDKSALNPSGIRLGTPALTTRNLKDADMSQVVHFIDEGNFDSDSLFSIKIVTDIFIGLKLAKEIKAASPGNLLKDFIATMHQDTYQAKIRALRDQVETFAEKFPLPGYDDY